MELFLLIIGIVAFASIMGALSLVLETHQMSDEERKELGLGPKGQGRK